MEKRKFSQGPWEIFNSQTQGWLPGIESANNINAVVYSTGNDDFYDSGGIHGSTWEEQQANARLIAAAPEMYELLIELLKNSIQVNALLPKANEDSVNLNFKAEQLLKKIDA